MRFLAIWQGLRLAAMSPWYHAACVIAGLMVDTSDTEKIGKKFICSIVDGVKVCEPQDEFSADIVNSNFRWCVTSHFVMVIVAIIVTSFNMKGRYDNKKSDRIEMPNAWLLSAQYLDMSSSYGYLLFSMYL